MNNEQATQWAIIELMGHQQIAGRYQEAAGGMHRVDVPETAAEAEPDSFRFTRLYSPAAIYSITFVDEWSARIAARMLSPKPIAVLGFEAEMKRLAAPVKAGDMLEYDGPEYFEDERSPRYDDDLDEDFTDDEED